MLVGVLISIMISIVVGVSLVPTIVASINTARVTIAATPNAPTGLAGLLDVLSYVFVAVILLGKSNGLCPSKTALIRGKLNTLVHANPELASQFGRASVETLQAVLIKSKEKVRTSLKGESELQAVAWIGGQA